MITCNICYEFPFYFFRAVISERRSNLLSCNENWSFHLKLFHCEFRTGVSLKYSSFATALIVENRDSPATIFLHLSGTFAKARRYLRIAVFVRFIIHSDYFICVFVFFVVLL